MPDGGVAISQVAQQGARTAQGSSLTVSILAIVLISLTLLFAVELVRALPWSAKAKSIKPLAGCDACAVGWALILGGGGLAAWQRSASWVLLHAIPAAGLAMLFLALRTYWKGPLPPEE